MFNSTDGGTSWSDSNDANLTNTANVQALAIDPDDPEVIYAGTDSGSMYISMDGGANWEVITGDISGTNVLSLAINPSATTTLYAGTAGEGLFMITEGGESSGTGGGGGGGCFIESVANGSPMSPQVQLGHLAATILVIATSLFTISLALLYFLRRLRLHGLVFEVAKVKRK